MSESYDVPISIKMKRIGDLIVQDKRLDGRGLLDYREIKVETGIIDKANGSALVSLGNTKVLTGIKVEVGTPFPDTPEEGVLTVNAELVPLASPSFEAGPPGEVSIELARVVDRGIRESKAIDGKKLCLIPGKKVLVVFVDIYILDHDGNLFDASALASILALTTAKIREFEVKDNEVYYKDNLVSLPLQNHVVEVTMGKIGDKLVVDPSLEEESAIDAQITIAVDDKGNICATQKSKTGIFRPEEVIEAVKIAQNKAAELREKVLGGSSNES
jgi:exosome complex component RRP42